MANTTNLENWAAHERVRAVERAAYWRGWVRRQELIRLFGVSMAQASSDLQKYQNLNPGALQYNLNVKRYESGPDMKCLLHEPRLVEALAFFLNGPGSVAALDPPTSAASDTSGTSSVEALHLPARRASARVERFLFMATENGCRVKVRYLSVHSGTDAWRWIRPHAFVHDGWRWHVRAWCEQGESYRDFVLGRMAGIKWPEPATDTESPPRDEDWECFVTLRFRPASDLDDVSRKAVALDFDMKNDVMEIRVRKALRDYVLHRLYAPLNGEVKATTLLERCD